MFFHHYIYNTKFHLINLQARNEPYEPKWLRLESNVSAVMALLTSLHSFLDFLDTILAEEMLFSPTI